METIQANTISSDLQAFIDEYRWEYPQSYIGSDFSDYIQVVGQSRDSGCLEESNFACALELLGGESETVIIEHASHWAVGWVECILVHETDIKALEIAKSIYGSLDDYPVLDECDFSEREYNEGMETLDTNMSYFTNRILEFLELDEIDEKDLPYNKEQLELAASEFFQADCGYRGYTEAFIEVDSFKSLASEYEIERSDSPVVKAILTKLNK